ncbi:MAG: radical SAM protein [Deltaproteobacteria bacterium]|nr:radical SAM protein [Deltaproteobacteria bacterium]
MPGHFLFIHVNQSAPVDSPDTIPISEATILAHLKNHGFSGQIIGDLANSPLNPRDLAKIASADQPLVIGFTAYQQSMEQIRLWARYAKKVLPETKVILGGPQVTFMPAEALRHMPEVDFLCRGEGEEVMLGLAQALSEGRDVVGVPGLCFLREDEAIETDPAYGAKELDTYASPYLMDLIDLRYKARAVMLTSRGCSFHCAFCYTPRASHRKVRFYSIERIVEEMKYLKSKGMPTFWFADPNFSFSRKRLVMLLEAIVREVPGITFWCQTRYDLVDEELISLLKRAGADNVAFGLESANPDVLERINKPIDPEHLSRVISLTQDAGINVELFSMFALPGETFGQALGTLEFVKKNRVAIEGNSISQQTHLFFGTPMNDDPAAYGIRPFVRTRPAYLSVCRDYETDTMSADDIHRMSLIWRVNRNDFAEDVFAEKNLFHRAALITQNRNSLKDRSEATCLLARIYLALEEYGGALDCMNLLRKEFPEDSGVQELLQGPFLCFKVNREKARPRFKVIYDCQGSVDGRLILATCGRFQEAVLGKGMLLPEFEKQLEGMSPGESARFDMTFPDNYGRTALAGTTVMFRISLHHTLEPVTVESCEGLNDETLRNQYQLENMEGLRQHNINLYYKALNQANLAGVTNDMTDSLALVNLYLKLGFVDQAEEVAGRLQENPVIFTHAAHIFRQNGQPRKALDILERAQQEGPREGLIRAEALFDLNQLEEAEAVVKDLELPNNIQLEELGVRLAARLALPIETYLEREEALLEAKAKIMLSPR